MFQKGENCHLLRGTIICLLKSQRGLEVKHLNKPKKLTHVQGMIVTGIWNQLVDPFSKLNIKIAGSASWPGLWSFKDHELFTAN